MWLASRSPRRRQLLTEHGLSHHAEHPGLEDSDLRPGEVTPDQWVTALAYLKASAGRERVASRGGMPRFILGADTACIKDGRLIGTPATAAEAREILRSLSSGEHAVVTGVSLLELLTGRRMLFADRALVRVGPLTDQDIEPYIASGQWQGKAGGYNLRERIDAGWPITFTGDPSTIMGLPMVALLRRLRPLIGLGGAA